jgi:hypothetical protein
MTVRRVPIRDWSQIYRQLDVRVLEGFGGRVGVRHHGPMGQEFPDAAVT